jgi:hypothetical protein
MADREHPAVDLVRQLAQELREAQTVIEYLQAQHQRYVDAAARERDQAAYDLALLRQQVKDLQRELRHAQQGPTWMGLAIARRIQPRPPTS